jgi:hypothetical protein
MLSMRFDNRACLRYQRSTMRTCIFVIIVSLCSSARAGVVLKGPKEVAAGQKLDVQFDLPKPRPVALRVTFKDADFAGATILTHVNDRAMLPYHAFGGDTRFDNVKGKPGMHPPVAKIQANYVLVAAWTKAGKNAVTVMNSGPGLATIESITVEDVGGHDLPVYENPIYFDFDVWRQASVMKPVAWPLDKRPEVQSYFDTMLLGIIPGGGNFVMNYGGGDTTPIKLAAEDARVNWGFGRSTFYSIWHLVMNAKQWAEFVDVDHLPAGAKPQALPSNATKEQKEEAESARRIHSQFINPPDVPAGTDIALIKPDGYLNVLKPGIDSLLPYVNECNFTCEQWGPRGQGFGRWFGNAFAAQGFDGKRWANNYQAEFSKLTKYVHERNPAAVIDAPQWWLPDIRFVLYDTAPSRGMRMADMTDSFMTHYYSMTFGGYRADGTLGVDDDKSLPPVVNPALQYPGGKFEKPDWDRSRAYMGTWVTIPEIAIDWNRYRLSRTEKDMKLGDPKVNRWPNGKPFAFEAGFDGDERSYNNETCVYDRNYSGPAPYQFLHAMFSYSLLPTGGNEPREMKITRTLPLTPEEPESEDVISTVDVPINRYGDWVDGAAHTKRLKTRDPLYGDLFGYTGFEQASTGDYIWLCGIKERNHRRAGADAWNLVRRTCYAFVTKAPVYPSSVNDADTSQLVVKTLLVSQGGHPVIGVYAVNFDTKPHTLDVSLPAPWKGAVLAQVFDESAADWADAKELNLTPAGGEIRHKATIPAGAPYAMFIYPPSEQATSAIARTTIPQPLSPWGNQNVKQGTLALKWRPSVAATTYEVQIAKELLFRAEDVLLTKGDIKAPMLKSPVVALEANHRYHWRVRAVDADGVSSGWSRPQSFSFEAAAPVTPPTPEAPAQALTVPRPEKAALDVAAFAAPGNLARDAELFSQPNYWEGAGEAVDGNAASAWLPDTTDANEGRKAHFPAWWAARFDKEQPVKQVTVLWRANKPAKEFAVQTWDGKAWKDQKSVADNKDAHSTIDFAATVSTRAVRVKILKPATDTTGIAEIAIR